MVLTVRFKDEGGWLEFSQPRRVLRSGSRREALAMLDEADAERKAGAWIAGLICYEWSGSVIGIFDPPRRYDSYESSPAAISPLLPTIHRERYRADISAIKSAIYDGDVYQVNYTVPFDCASDGDVTALWHRIADSTHARYQAMLVEETRSVLSWSPELFLAFDGEQVIAKPMKGTADPTHVEALDDLKNRAEHIMIVDLLRNDLHRICDDVRVTALCTHERYPTFATMTSTIEGTVRHGTTLGDIFDATFPCGSVTGAPKIAAMEQIASLEGRSRGAYCGSLGFLSPQGHGWWNVAIRTAQFDGTRGRLDAGGGIVSDSDAGSEWQEIAVKTRFLRSASEDGFTLWETFSGDADDETIAAHCQRLAKTYRGFGYPREADDLAERFRCERKGGTLVRVRAGFDGSLQFMHEPLAITQEPVAICLSNETVHSGDPWLRIKSSWRPAHRRASHRASALDCFDALLINERGCITEGTRTNVFARIDGVLYTPPVASGLLPGILRAKLLACGRAQERELRADDLERASELYVGNSARGLLRANLVE